MQATTLCDRLSNIICACRLEQSSFDMDIVRACVLNTLRSRLTARTCRSLLQKGSIEDVLLIEHIVRVNRSLRLERPHIHRYLHHLATCTRHGYESHDRYVPFHARVSASYLVEKTKSWVGYEYLTRCVYPVDLCGWSIFQQIAGPSSVTAESAPQMIAAYVNEQRLLRYIQRITQ